AARAEGRVLRRPPPARPLPRPARALRQAAALDGPRVAPQAPHLPRRPPRRPRAGGRARRPRAPRPRVRPARCFGGLTWRFPVPSWWFPTLLLLATTSSNDWPLTREGSA